MKGDRFVSIRGNSNTNERKQRVYSVVSILSWNLSFPIIADDAPVIARSWFFPSMSRNSPR